MDVQSRLRKFLNHKNLTYKAFEINCGFGNGTAKRFNETIKKRTIDSIVAVYPELNAHWLLTGEGEMLNAAAPKKANDSASRSASSKNDVMLVPLLSLDARGGFGGNLEAGSEYVEKLVPWQGARSGDFVVLVSGLSMMPNIEPGSFVLLRQVEGWQWFLEYNRLYVIELNDDRRLLKIIAPSEQGNEYISLVSYNPDFPRQDIALSFVRRVFKVVGHMTQYGF